MKERVRERRRGKKSAGAEVESCRWRGVMKGVMEGKRVMCLLVNSASRVISTNILKSVVQYRESTVWKDDDRCEIGVNGCFFKTSFVWNTRLYQEEFKINDMTRARGYLF